MPDTAAVQDALERILRSAGFVNSPRMSRFLRFVVEETVAGRNEQLKEYVVGVRVFGKAESYDPAVDPTVRVEASKLRAKLDRYYDAEGRREPIRIEIPKGGYSARFSLRADTGNGQSSVADTVPLSQTTSDNGAPATTKTRRFSPASLRERIVWSVAGLFGIALVIVVVGMVVTMALDRSGGPRRVLLSNPIQITAASGVEGWPTWSPDGRMVAYAADQSGNFDIWVSQIDGSPPVNRTQDHTGSDRSPSWSPDGNQIAYISTRGGTPAVYVMNPLSGQARRIAEPAFGTPQWSPDSTELAFLVPTRPRSVAEIVSLKTGASRRVPLFVGDLLAFDLRWSADGRYFAYTLGAGTRTLVAQIWLHRLHDREAFAITDGLNNDREPAWAPDGRSIFYTSDKGGGTDLWQQRLGPDAKPVGAPEPITAGVGARAAALSRDGARVSYMKGGIFANLWRVPILADRRATWADAEQLTFEQSFIEAVDLSPDGTRLLIGSDRSGNHDVWLRLVTGSDWAQLTTDQAADWGPRWAPDGSRLVFYSYRSGNRDVWTMPLEGGPARQVTHYPGQDMWPKWLPDGERVSFHSNRTGTWATYVARADGADERLLVADGEFAEWSPTGQWISFSRSSGLGLWMVSASGTGERQLIGAAIGSHRWSADASTIYAVSGTDLLAISPEDGRDRRLTDFGGRRGILGEFALATDGRYLYFTWDESFGDLWVMSATDEAR